MVKLVRILLDCGVILTIVVDTPLAEFKIPIPNSIFYFIILFNFKTFYMIYQRLSRKMVQESRSISWDLFYDADLVMNIPNFMKNKCFLATTRPLQKTVLLPCLDNKRWSYAIVNYYADRVHKKGANNFLTT